MRKQLLSLLTGLLFLFSGMLYAAPKENQFGFEQVNLYPAEKYQVELTNKEVAVENPVIIIIYIDNDGDGYVDEIIIIVIEN